jgi:acyl carrier protein
VLGVGDSGAGRELVAYVVAAAGESPTDVDLSAYLRCRLPDYMVPARYVWLAELPVTPHGKLDRAALEVPAPAEPRPLLVEEGSAHRPLTELERTIASVVAELLAVERIGLDENFFLLGGHSMLGAQLIVRLEDLFGAEVSLRYLFDHPTLAEIAEEVQRQTSDGRAADLVA